MNPKVLTLCLVHEHPRILLGMKKRGFGVGRWNGFGGKVEPGEAIESAARRELVEEVGLVADALEQVGRVAFEFEGDPVPLDVHIFRVGEFKGEPQETEEMRPQWFMVDSIPFRDMWPDDLHWMPLFLKGEKFRGRFVFRGHDEILHHELNVVESFSNTATP